ncbi:MAG: hypothetical protein DRQ55_00865 [Planctomycetota bacterium]|nr:MAG: hypothetical protein DRQ55_00865 [Planctomycetota bacterium]
MIRLGVLFVALLLPACASPSAQADAARGGSERGAEALSASEARDAAAAQGDSAADVDAVGGAAIGAGSSSDPQLLPSGRSLPPPSLRPESMVAYALLGPAPGTARADYDAWAALVAERFYGQPDEAQLASIERELSDVHVVELTPVYLDLTVGLDMALASDVELAAALTSDWYVRQLRFKQVVLPESRSQDLRAMVPTRLKVLDSWHRWWERTASDPERVERFRTRIDDLLWELRRVGRDPAEH